ncbi:hypothetical protein MOJ79_12160 [Calidifontimicrobium sp. SYSU G02091]|uniref:hypothetical protein n=1 Tax=Calidifontimicrobium sp. SYSU G02091 TaxID=2926421 RepID=UPI001F534232|nr:hypothetical protein [Calidifontimicrobium sp. SYSU G02091]MCI1192598.1 hypothetical protein [Calidifontimicrobium sp. SYSU G02091]
MLFAVSPREQLLFLGSPLEAELEIDAGGYFGAPPEGKAPRHMPPNARLVVEVEWSWSPMHSRRPRYFISGNRDGSLWLLWQRYFGDNYSRRERAARLVAYASKRDVPEAVAAARMLAACWRRAGGARSTRRTWTNTTRYLTRASLARTSWRCSLRRFGRNDDKQW